MIFKFSEVYSQNELKNHVWKVNAELYINIQCQPNDYVYMFTIILGNIN